MTMNQRTLFLVGLPDTWKTTVARRLEVEHHALRLTKDEWMKALYGDENPSSASDVIEGRLMASDTGRGRRERADRRSSRRFRHLGRVARTSLASVRGVTLARRISHR